MEFTIFGKTFFIGYLKEKEAPKKALKALMSNTQKKIQKALISMIENEVKYSEYALQKESGVSINTIKKYRKEIEQYKKSFSESYKNKIFWEQNAKKYQSNNREYPDIDWDKELNKKKTAIPKKRSINTSKRAEDNKQKIINLLNESGNDYKKSDGSWNKSKIGKTLKLDRNTVAKHLKDIKF